MFVILLNEDIGPFCCIQTEFAIVKNMSKIVQSPLTCAFMVFDLHLITHQSNNRALIKKNIQITPMYLNPMHIYRYLLTCYE